MPRKAGVREARQNLSRLIDEVRKGREILITERGTVVARLVPPAPRAQGGLPDLSAFRRRIAAQISPGTTLVEAILEDREDRF